MLVEPVSAGLHLVAIQLAYKFQVNHSLVVLPADNTRIASRRVEALPGAKRRAHGTADQEHWLFPCNASSSLFASFRYAEIPRFPLLIDGREIKG